MTTAFAMPLALPLIATFLAFFSRTAAFMATVPFYSDHGLPKKARAAIAAALAFAMAAAHGPMEPVTLGYIIPLELALGAALGLGARLVIAGIETGGELIGQHLGLGFAATVDRRVGEEALPTRTLANVAAGLVYFAADGPTLAIRALALPLPGTASPRALARLLIVRTGDVFLAAVQFAAPVLLASLVANVGFALASRAAPGLNIFSVAFAGVLLIGGLALLLTAGHFNALLHGHVSRIPDVLLQLVEAR